MLTKVRNAIHAEVEDYRILLRNIPSVSMALFVVSVVAMNLLANRSLNIPVSWIAADCGILVSWLSFLAMDMITKRFGPKASIKVSLVAVGINLLMCLLFVGVTYLPGTWGEFYTFENEIVNSALDNTIAGTWYVVFGSTVAFVTSAVVNAIINYGVGHLLKKDNFVSYAIRSYVSTLIAQFVDNLVFALIVSHNFFGWTMIQCITCSAIGCVIELLCEVVFSPFGYKVSKKWEKDGVGQQYIDFASNKEDN